MHPRTESFRDRAREEFGFAVEVHEFAEGTKTAADAAAAIGCDIAQIASSIAIATDEGLTVVVTSGAHRVDMDAVADRLGVEWAEMADPDTVKETLGWGIGGVPPFCHDAEVPVLVDETLHEHEEVWAAAGTPAAVFPIGPDELERHAEGTAARIHE